MHVRPTGSLARLVLLGAMLWAVGLTAAFSAEITLRCDEPVSPGYNYSACGSVSEVELGALTASDRIVSCFGGSGSGVCSEIGGVPVWLLVRWIQPGDLVYSGGLSAGSYVASESLPEWPYFVIGDPPDSGGEGFDLGDLDPDNILGAFSAGFFLVALFWGFGKGIALILQQVKR